MTKVGTAERPDRFRGGPPSLVTWLFRGLLLLLIGGVLLFGVANLIAAAGYLVYLASAATVFDTWGVLNIISALFSLTAVAGAGFALWRRKPVLALVFTVLALLPTSFVIEATRCDTAASCRMMGWAGLPATAFDWQIRLRPVTDPNEAEEIASGAVSKTGSGNSPFRAKRFGDHWIVSTIDHDGWPGAQAVRIDTRTAQTSLVACPGDQIQCGMERPVVSDGRRVFRNEKIGLAATFPAARAVCTARGDDHEPRGFFGMARPPDEPCDIIDDSPQMGVEIARYRLNGCMVVEAPSLPWRPLSPESAKLFEEVSAPTLGGRPGVPCELRRNGSVQISVYASAAAGSSGPLYQAYIVTTPARLADDIRAFEVFLAAVRIGAP